MKINIAIRKHIGGLTFWVNAERSKHECTTWNLLFLFIKLKKKTKCTGENTVE